ncbi:MAG: InlB B-repeat-containing protein [Atopobiaceae bacterium]|nr:InlB B-repeat-containing protein [Atopobiaceae bacterium]
MRCQNCGRQNNPGAGFCAGCGAPLDAPYGMQQNQVVVQPAPRRNNNLPIMVGLSIALVLAIGLGVFAIWNTKSHVNASTSNQPTSRTELIIQNFIGAIYNNDYGRIRPRQILTYGPIVHRCLPYMRPGVVLSKKFKKEIARVFINNDNRKYTRTMVNRPTIIHRGGDTYYIRVPYVPTPREVETFTIAYDANGGTGGMSPLEVEKGHSANVSNCGFGNSGYRFVSWNTQPGGGGTGFVAGEAVTPNGDMTLFAQWVKDEDPAPETYTIAFDSNGGTGDMTTLEVEKGKSANASKCDFERDGYEFDGWNTQAGGGGTAYAEGESVTPTGNMTLYAQWIEEESEPETYVVTYDANGGTGSMDEEEVEEGDTFTAASADFERDGYEFDGWNTQAGGNGTAYAEGETVKPTGDMTLYAQWTEEGSESEMYVVTYDANGGTGSMDEEEVEEGESFTTASADFERDGYEFDGWNTQAGGNGAAYAEGETVTPTGDMTLYAQWAEGESDSDPVSETYVVTYDGNGGTGSMYDEEVEEGQAFTVASNGFTWDGYEFEGWNTQADGSGAAYTEGESVTPTENMTLYAQWTEGEPQANSSSDYPDEPTPGATYYYIAFDGNGGMGYTDGMQVEEGQSASLNYNAFTREGYEFTGWNTDASGSGESYADGGTITPTSNVTLYAQWAQVAEEPPATEPTDEPKNTDTPDTPSEDDVREDEWAVQVDDEGKITDIENTEDGGVPETQPETQPEAGPQEVVASSDQEENAVVDEDVPGGESV